MHLGDASIRGNEGDFDNPATKCVALLRHGAFEAPCDPDSLRERRRFQDRAGRHEEHAVDSSSEDATRFQVSGTATTERQADRDINGDDGSPGKGLYQSAELRVHARFREFATGEANRHPPTSSPVYSHDLHRCGSIMSVLCRDRTLPVPPPPPSSDLSRIQRQQWLRRATAHPSQEVPRKMSEAPSPTSRPFGARN